MDQKQLRFYCQTGNLKQIREGLDLLAVEQKAEALRVVLQSSLRVEVLEYLGAELLRLPHAIAAPILVELLYSEEAATRNIAVELLPSMGSVAIDILSNHLNDLDSDVRLFAVQALSQIPSRYEVLQLLRNQLEVEKEINILSFLIEAIGDVGDPEDVELIQNLAERYPHPYLGFVVQRSILRLNAKSEVPNPT